MDVYHHDSSSYDTIRTNTRVELLMCSTTWQTQLMTVISSRKTGDKFLASVSWFCLSVSLVIMKYMLSAVANFSASVFVF